MECDEIVQLQKLLSSNIDLLIESGFNMPIANVNRDNIVKATTLQSVILSSSAELSQF